MHRAVAAVPRTKPNVGQDSESEAARPLKALLVYLVVREVRDPQAHDDQQAMPSIKDNSSS